MESLNKFEQDFDNIFNIKDYFIVESKDEMKSLIDEFSTEEKIEKVKNGIFSCKINNKYMLISKSDIKQYYSEFYKTLLKINNQFYQFKNLD
jgi:plasmid maintenance system killer protein